MPKTDGYPAHILIEALASAKECSRRAKAPFHVIDRDGALHVVKTICDSDHVVARDVMAPRRTGPMISAEVEAMTELRSALPYVQRAVEILKAKGFADGPDAEEVVADLIEDSYHSLAFNRRNEKEPAMSVPYTRSPSIFARMFGRAVHG